MRFQQIATIILVISVIWGCQQNTHKDKANAENEGTSPQEQPSQTQQNLNQLQSQSQGNQVSDKELHQFVSVSQHIEAINQQAQQSMVTTVENEGLEIQRYTEIQQAQQDPNQAANATEEELIQYAAVTQELQNIQAKAQQQMQEKLDEEGLTGSRFQEISMVLQNDIQLQEKLRSIQQQTN